MSSIERFHEISSFFWLVALQSSSILVFFVSAGKPDSLVATKSEHPDTIYNLLAPPDYALCVWFVVVVNCLGSMSNLPCTRYSRHCSSLFGRIMMARSNYTMAILLVAVVIFPLLVVCLLYFVFFGRFRLYLSPITLMLMWFGIKYFNAKVEGGFEVKPRRAKDLIWLALCELCVHITFIWSAAAFIFSVIDILQFWHGDYFSSHTYMKIMRLLLALAVGAYAYSRDVMVAWIATWFIVGLANRENTYENEQKETFEMLQTGATIVTPMFAVVLVVDTAQSLYQFLDKFVPRVDDSFPESEEQHITVYGSV